MNGKPWEYMRGAQSLLVISSNYARVTTFGLSKWTMSHGPRPYESRFAYVKATACMTGGTTAVCARRVWLTITPDGLIRRSESPISGAGGRRSTKPVFLETIFARQAHGFRGLIATLILPQARSLALSATESVCYSRRLSSAANLTLYANPGTVGLDNPALYSDGGGTSVPRPPAPRHTRGQLRVSQQSKIPRPSLFLTRTVRLAE